MAELEPENCGTYSHLTMRLGHPLSNEHKAKLRAAAKGRIPSDTCLKAAHDSNRGRHPSEETRAKMSLAQKTEENQQKRLAVHLGLHPSDETRARMSDAHKGRTLSAEARAKISATLMGHPMSDRAREAVSNANRGRAISLEVRAKISATNKLRTGALCSQWKGGVTPEQVRVRNSKPYAVWRTEVFVRDDYVCQRCGSKGKRLTVHHMDSFADYPDKRLDASNGITLCERCHDELHRQYGISHARRNQMDTFLSGGAPCQ